MEVLTFLLGEDKYAIDITIVDAIENVIPATPVPKAKPYVKGLINIRGSVLPVIDIGMVLGKEWDNSILPKLVIVSLSSGSIALAVTDIDEVLNVEKDDIEVIDSSKNVSVISFGEEVITLLTQDYLLSI